MKLISSKVISKGNLKTLAVVVGVALLLYFLYRVRDLILFAFIAGVISLICRPVVVFLKNRLRFNNTWASFVTLLLVIGFFVGIIWVFFPIVIDQSKNISEIDFDSVKKDLNELNIQASEYLGVEQINIVEAVKRTAFIQNFNSEIISGFVDIFFSNIGTLVAGIFSVLFMAFFFLKDDKMITRAVAAFAADGKERKFITVLHKVRNLLSRYFVGLLIQTCIISVLYLILLMILGVKNALAIAIICGFLNIVPYLGPLIGAAVIILVVVSNNLGADFSSELLPLVFKVVIGAALVQLIDNLISQPYIFSQSVRSHPLEIFVVIIIGGLLFNIGGMILAVPVYTTLKVISKEFFAEYKIVKHLTRDL